MGHLSAASGLVCASDRLYVIGDDELHLAQFARAGAEPGRLIRLFAGSLPQAHKARKAAKPDLEVLLALPPATGWPHGALLALGSGSTERRRRGVLAEFDRQGEVGQVRVLELASLYTVLAAAVDELNIEGAVVAGDRLILFNRGNSAHPDTVAMAVDLACATKGGATEILSRTSIRLGLADGVPLAVTDACALDDGTMLVSAVAEDTNNAYDDGRLAGAAIAVLNADLRPVRVEAIDPPVKIEGLHALRDGDQIRLLAVNDPDDPAVAGGLYAGELTG